MDIKAEIMLAAWTLPEREKYFKGLTKAITNLETFESSL